jgi:uncharacterized protein (DUF849 family)
MATAKSRKVIISSAITGSIHTPTMSEALPITPDEIATQAIEAAEAGAAILHLHARDRRTVVRPRIPPFTCDSCLASNRRPMRS